VAELFEIAGEILLVRGDAGVPGRLSLRKLPI
jgi:hypothetical protein